MTGEVDHTRMFVFVRVWGEESQHFKVVVSLTLSFPASSVSAKCTDKMVKTGV